MKDVRNIRMLVVLVAFLGVLVFATGASGLNCSTTYCELCPVSSCTCPPSSQWPGETVTCQTWLQDCYWSIFASMEQRQTPATDFALGSREAFLQSLSESANENPAQTL